MAVGFSRTTRSLEADSYRRWLLGLVVGMLLLLLWGLWFFRAEIRFHATSDAAVVLDDGALRAEFPAGSGAPLRPGQVARFLPEGVSVPGPVRVIVTDVHEPPGSGPLQVDLVIAARRDPGLLLAPGTTGRVRIETERLSPAQLVLRLSGGRDTVR
ncbi:MAG: hypothetical protein R3202_14700 [Candidatus Competibacterales bacterium]|nr:hypothetical protein [Candidatus Competibacterales bacterium]